MSNLILLIISILLIAIVAGATLFYGDERFTRSKIEAEASSYINESTQIQSAVVLYKSKGNTIDPSLTIGQLVSEGYLENLPNAWAPGQNVFHRAMEGDDEKNQPVCYEANSMAGYQFYSSESHTVPYVNDNYFAIPQCDYPGLESSVPCCVNVSDS